MARLLQLPQQAMIWGKNRERRRTGAFLLEGDRYLERHLMSEELLFPPNHFAPPFELTPHWYLRTSFWQELLNCLGRL